MDVLVTSAVSALRETIIKFNEQCSKPDDSDASADLGDCSPYYSVDYWNSYTFAQEIVPGTMEEIPLSLVPDYAGRHCPAA